MALQVGKVSDALTFSRASRASYFDARGILRMAEINELRRDHDPVTGEALGLLLEPTRTNLCLQSANLLVSPWGSSNGIIIQPSTVLAPDGSTSAVKIIAPATATQAYRWQFFTFPGVGQKASIRIFARFDSWRYYQLWMPGGAQGTSSRYINIDLINRIATSSLASAVSVKTVLLPNSWMMIDSTWLMEGDGTATGTGGMPGILINPINSMSETRRPIVTGDGVSGSLFWGGQHEAGGLEIGSYIPTTTTAVTRAADVANIPVGDWFSENEGTLFVEYLRRHTGAGYLSTINRLSHASGQPDPRHQISFPGTASTAEYASVSDGGIVSPVVSGPVIIGSNKIAIRYGAGEHAISVNGSAAIAGAPGAVEPTLQALIRLG